MDTRKIVSAVLIIISIIGVLAQPFGLGEVIDDHYRRPPPGELIFVVTLMVGIMIWPGMGSELANREVGNNGAC